MSEALSSKDLDELVPQLLIIEAWTEAVRAEIQRRLEAGETFSNGRLVPKRANRSWIDETAVKAVLSQYLEEDEYNPRKLISPAQAEDVLSRSRRAELVQHTQRISSGLTLSLGVPRGTSQPKD